ncbi:hypothetical protein PGQ11_003984 [Apiospora arundinis]|uniref:Uncharacterized protein n=1 Tax=Apiospora arundinis TaxID=335852 RepID=A0ABR2J6P8_9PEZI
MRTIPGTLPGEISLLHFLNVWGTVWARLFTEDARTALAWGSPSIKWMDAVRERICPPSIASVAGPSPDARLHSVARPRRQPRVLHGGGALASRGCGTYTAYIQRLHVVAIAVVSPYPRVRPHRGGRQVEENVLGNVEVANQQVGGGYAMPCRNYEVLSYGQLPMTAALGLGSRTITSWDLGPQPVLDIWRDRLARGVMPGNQECEKQALKQLAKTPRTRARRT